MEGFPENPKAVVTGGAGFIGANLTRSLVAAGWEVFVIDDLSTGRIENLPEGVPVLRADVRDITDDVLCPDVIWHLACPASPPVYQSDPQRTFDVALDGTRAVLRVAEKAKCRVVVASTSEVYGDPEEHPQTEEYRGCVNLHGPRSCYDVGKRAAETLCYLARERGVDVVVARIHNTYGPWMRIDDGRMVTNFLRAVTRGEPLPIYGSGMQTRSPTFVDDMVEALRQLAVKPGGDHYVFNLGADTELTVIDIALACAAVVHGGEARIAFHPLPGDDPARRCPVVTRFVQSYGWNPFHTPLELGLRATYEHLCRRGEL